MEMALLRLSLALMASLSFVSLPGSEACSCQRDPILLQDLFCRSEYVIGVTPIGNEIINDTPANSIFGSSPRRRYTVETTKVYKSSPRYDGLGNKNFIFTAIHSAACGVNLQENVTYVIFGELGTNNEISINLCGFSGFTLDGLNTDQQCGLDYAYKQGCDKCKIEYGRDTVGDGQQLVSSKPSCIFDQGDAARNCYDKHAVCKFRRTWRGLQCLWTDLGSGKFESCLDNLPEEP